MEEKRRHIRAPLVVKATNRATKEFHFFYTTDISQGGMFLQSKAPYPEGTEVELDFFVSLKERKEHLLLKGRVIRFQPYDIKEQNDSTAGMGVEFVDLEPRDIAVVSQYVRHTLKDGA